MDTENKNQNSSTVTVFPSTPEFNNATSSLIFLGVILTTLDRIFLEIIIPLLLTFTTTHQSFKRSYFPIGLLKL